MPKSNPSKKQGLFKSLEHDYQVLKICLKNCNRR